MSYGCFGFGYNNDTGLPGRTLLPKDPVGFLVQEIEAFQISDIIDDH
jgi:hypothetical protein